MKHPYISELELFTYPPLFLEELITISPLNMPFIYEYENRDEVFSLFIKEYAELMTKLKEVYFYPEKTIEISHLSKCPDLSMIDIPIYKIKNLEFILKLNKLYYIGSGGFCYTSFSTGKSLGFLKRIIKYKKNISKILNDRDINK